LPAKKIKKMSPDCLYSITDAEALVAGFTNCTLPKEEWTHEAHLVSGLYMLAHYGPKALDEMRLRIRRYNESVGGQNTDVSGYHETMTVFWLWAIKKQCAGEDGFVRWNQDTLDRLVACEQLTDRNCWLEHYSEGVIKSVEARREFVPPDRRSMDGFPG
jgi:hypothetical protein